MTRTLIQQAWRRSMLMVAVLAATASAPGAVLAQSGAQQAIDSDLARQAVPTPPLPQPAQVPVPPPSGWSATPGVAAAPAAPADPTASPRYMYPPPQTGPSQPAAGQAGAGAQMGANGCAPARSADGTYQKDDLIGAATGVFGTGAHGLADIIESILHKQGRPNGYIVGREAGGAIAVGLRYGSGALCTVAEGGLPVYWTGPSLGFDAGASAAKTFVLVYNLDHNQDIFHRFPAGEGQAYLVGGLHVSYLRHGRVVLIPVRMGVGMRLGVNGGYMKFSRHQNWFPF